MHASTVALILNPNTNRLSPQFHCVFDDYFETVHHKGDGPPPVWDDLVIRSRFKNEFEGDLDDTWDETAPNVVKSDPTAKQKAPQQPDNGDSAQSPLPDVPRPSPDEESPRLSGDTQETPSPAPDTPTEEPVADPPERPSPRRSTRVRKPVDRFTPDKAHGYSTIRRFTSNLVKYICIFSAARAVHDVHYTTALAMDPVFGVLDGLSSLPPDYLTSHPWMLKSKKGKDPDTPTIREALTGPYHDEFLKAMSLEIDELEAHGTWTVVKKSEVPQDSQIIPLTWAYKVKHWPSGLLRKIKARICV